MIPFNGLLQALFKLISARRDTAFIAALNDPKAAQDVILRKIMDNLPYTEYGKFYRLTEKNTYENFSKQLPIVDYNALALWIEKAKFTPGILTKYPIDHFEYTSGSQGYKKAIPYTKDLKRSFSNCFKIWGADCLRGPIQFKFMKMFLSVSPQPSRNITVGLNYQDDSDYVQGALKYLIRPFLVSPPDNIYQLKDLDDFRFKLALTLLAAQDLEIISIWSPTYLLLLLEKIENHFDEMLCTVRAFSQKRFSYLKSLSSIDSWEIIWPNLKMISCWKSSHSGKAAKILEAKFPNTFIQGKGLLATEAPMTVPILDAKGYVPLLNDVFFEFEDENKDLWRLHELREGKIYEIIISQLGGLVRYRLGDKVKVTHFYRKTPCLEFMGRANQTSDMVGEKLNEDFVASIFKHSLFQSSVLLLVPRILPSGQGRYHLLTDESALSSQEDKIDDLLRQAFHYANARDLQQLIKAKVIFHPRMGALITQIKERMGIKWGDQKESLLICCPKTGETLLDHVSALC